MKRFRKSLSVLLTIVLFVSLFSAAAFASGEVENGEASAEGSGSAGQEFGTFAETAAAAGIVIENGAVRYADDWNGTASGEITAEGMTGASITADEANGVAITMANETDVYVIEDSDISVTSGQKNNDLGYEAAYGVGVSVHTGELWIKNSRLSSEGPRSTPVYMFNTSQPAATSLVVIDSEISTYTDNEDIWMPPFKLLAGGSRATLLMTRNNSWFINSTVTSNNWGAISQDSVDAITYVVNSSGTAMSGGYGTYLTYTMYLYASQLYGGQYGAFMCGDSLLVTGSADDALADADAMSKTPDYVPADEPTIIAAPVNAIVVHTSTGGLSRLAVGNFKGATLSTMLADLPGSVSPMAADDPFFMQDAPFGVGGGTAYFYNRNLYGSLILVRSMNGDFTFDDTDARSSNGVLLQTVITYDPPQNIGYLAPGEGESEEIPGVSVTFKNGVYTGDILHQDYHRRMNVTVGENAVLTGAIVSGTWQGWNDLWSEEALRDVLEADGYDEVPFASETWVADVQENLTLAEDAAYADTENLGADVTVTAGGTWIVTGDSTLSSLTLEPGAVVTAPDGGTLTVCVDADASNAGSTYTGGTPIDALAAGTYNNVILTVSEDAGTPSAEPSGEASGEASGGASEEASGEASGENTVTFRTVNPFAGEITVIVTYKGDAASGIELVSVIDPDLNGGEDILPVQSEEVVAGLIEQVLDAIG